MVTFLHREISLGKLDGEQVIPQRKSPASIHRIVMSWWRKDGYIKHQAMHEH